jgi:hypothetical protein
MLDEDGIARLAQACFYKNPVIILGSGASLPHGLPSMGQLQAHLDVNFEAEAGEQAAWQSVKDSLTAGSHLEQAMAGKTLPESLVSKLVKETWKFINVHDRDVYLKTIQGIEPFPSGRLFDQLFSSSNMEVNVVTTNYDRVVEYACGSVGLIYSMGFSPGYLQYREGADVFKIYKGNRPVRLVRIWKVHGSLDWFEREDGDLVAAPLFELPEEVLKPLIVTPGISKYERTHDEPFRTVIQNADRCLENAEGYLCVGFGFRDSHIEPKLVERCRRNNIPITVLSRTLTDEARTFLEKKAGAAYLAFEKFNDGTKVYTSENPEGVEIPGKNYWSLTGYLQLVT